MTEETDISKEAQDYAFQQGHILGGSSSYSNTLATAEVKAFMAGQQRPDFATIKKIVELAETFKETKNASRRIYNFLRRNDDNRLEEENSRD